MTPLGNSHFWFGQLSEWTYLNRLFLGMLFIEKKLYRFKVMRIFGFILLMIVSLQQTVFGQKRTKFLDLEDLICWRDANFKLDSTKVILIVRNYRFKMPLKFIKNWTY